MLSRAGEPRRCATVAVEEIQAERLHRARQPPHPFEPVAPEREREPRGGDHRRYPAEHGLDETLRERKQLLHRFDPARAGGAQRCGRRVDVAMQGDRAPVRERVGEHHAGIDPVHIEVQLAHRG